MHIFGWLAVIGICCFVTMILTAGGFQPIITAGIVAETARIQAMGNVELSKDRLAEYERMQRAGLSEVPAVKKLPRCRDVWNAGFYPRAGENCRAEIGG